MKMGLTVLPGAPADVAVVGAIAPGTTGATTTRDGVADRRTLTTTESLSPRQNVLGRRRRRSDKGRKPEHRKGRDDGNAHLEGKVDKLMNGSKYGL